MLILRIPIKFDSELDTKSLIKIYSTILPRLKRQVLRSLSKYDSTTLSKKLLKSNEIMFRNNVNGDTLFEDIVKYIINRLGVYVDDTGYVDYRIVSKVRNPFADNVTLDNLARIIEFGNADIKSTRIFNNSMINLLPNIKRLYELTYKPNVITDKKVIY